LNFSNMTNVKLTLLLLMSLCLSLVSPASYSDHAAILIDADNGTIVYEQDANHAWFPASLTKVMTLYMTFTALSQGQVQLTDTMTASVYAARQPNSKLGLRPGENITVEEAILALITRSANDAAVVLAEHLGGNEENFATRMTAKAHSLGMYDTHFMNATGLPHQWQVTTPRDLGLLAYRTMQDFPNFYPYFASHSLFFRGREWPAINKFTASYPGAEGMKTGFTCGSGYNLISTAQQNGKRLIGVIMGGMTSPQRYQLMTAMMDNGFSNNLPPHADKHISAIPTKTFSSPPYQLGCGRDAPRTSYAQYTPPAAPRHNNSHAVHLRSSHAVRPRHIVASHAIPRAAKRVASKAQPLRLARATIPSKTRYHRSR
jgi:D-alanyl-D-alanine carboxypeptidase